MPGAGPLPPRGGGSTTTAPARRTLVPFGRPASSPPSASRAKMSSTTTCGRVPGALRRLRSFSSRPSSCRSRSMSFSQTRSSPFSENALAISRLPDAVGIFVRCSCRMSSRVGRKSPGRAAWPPALPAAFDPVPGLLRAKAQAFFLRGGLLRGRLSWPPAFAPPPCGSASCRRRPWPPSRRSAPAPRRASPTSGPCPWAASR